MQTRSKRLLLIAAGAACLLVAAGAFALHLATQTLKDKVQAALGPNSTIADIDVHWSSIELRGVHVRANPGWPASETLRADRVVVTPDLRSLLSDQVHIGSVVVDNPYLSLLRARDGSLHLLPGILDDTATPANDKATAGASQRQVSIGKVEIHGGTVEFFDASIRQPAHKILLEQLNAEVGDIHVPSQPGHMKLKLDGLVKGTQGDGHLGLDGWIDLTNMDSDIATTLQGVDLITLQPYLVKATETGVKRGTLDMSLHSKVQNHRLQAPGTVTLNSLELDSGNGAMATFMGVPRRAAIASLKDKGNRIVVPFTLDGNLDDPHFSLNDSLASHLGGAVANVLGISIEGLTHGVGSAAESVGGMVKKLFGK